MKPTQFIGDCDCSLPDGMPPSSGRQMVETTNPPSHTKVIHLSFTAQRCHIGNKSPNALDADWDFFTLFIHLYFCKPVVFCILHFLFEGECYVVGCMSVGSDGNQFSSELLIQS